MTTQQKDAQYIDPQELLASIKELREAQKKTDEQIKKTDEQIAQVSCNVDGINTSIGKEAEEFFYSSLVKKSKLADIDFDYISKNYKKRKKGEELEIDIFLENGNSVGIVEVKNRVSEKHIKELERDIEKFKAFSPAFAGYKVYGAIAGKVVPDHIQAKILKKGFYVLKQQGDHLEVTPPTQKK